MEGRTHDLPVTATAERGRWVFVGLSVLAGGLSVRPDGLGTPLVAIGAGLMAWLAFRVWRWSRLPSFQRVHGEQDPFWRFLQPLRWLTLGLVLGLGTLAVITGVLEPVLPEIDARIAHAGTLPVWRRLTIIYVAAIIEELIFRLLLLSALVGLATRLSRQTTLVPTPGIVWSANAVSALAFAVVHLPAWAARTADDPGMIVAVLALNWVAGLVLGYVFATRGLAAAIWTHAGADCAVQLLGPLASGPP